MTRIILCGILGRLGSAVERSCAAAGDIEVVCGVDRAARVSSPDGAMVYSSLFAALPEADLLVDCSSPSHLPQVVSFCEQRGMPLLSCVTGYSKQQEKLFERLGQQSAVLRCPNMASGIPAFLQVLEQAVSRLRPTAADLVETHRVGKKDTPSGTALLIAARLRQLGCAVNVSSVRKARADGSHAVTLYFDDQQLTLSHCVCSTAAYGAGAPPLIRRAVSLPAGVYASV